MASATAVSEALDAAAKRSTAMSTMQLRSHTPCSANAAHRRTTQPPRVRAPRNAAHLLIVQASKGFGASKKRSEPAAAPAPAKAKAPAKAAPSQLRYTATPAQLAKGNWLDVLPSVDAFFNEAGKDIKALTLSAGRTLVLYRHNGIVYCSDVNSTAYQFPMIDAKVIPNGGVGGAGPAVEVPLDGTLYDLTTGKVLKWCPKSENLIQNVFATLKRSATPTDLPVFPTHITPDGKLRVRLVTD